MREAQATPTELGVALSGRLRQRSMREAQATPTEESDSHVKIVSIMSKNGLKNLTL